MTAARLSIEQRLLVLATAIGDVHFEEDSDKIASMLIEGARTIIELRTQVDSAKPAVTAPQC